MGRRTPIITELPMNDTVDVRLVRIPEHDTLGDALRVPAERRASVERISRHVAGSPVKEFAYRWNQLAFLLSNQSILRFFLNGDLVQCSLSTDETWRSQSPKIRGDVRLRFPTGAVEHWRWSDLLRDIRGGEILGVSASECWIWLYVRGVPDLLFSALVDLKTEHRFLHFGPDA
jgi:hypothetical protein